MENNVLIGELDFVEKLLIPMQNLSMTLAGIADGNIKISEHDLIAGMKYARANAENITLFLNTLRNGEGEERTLKLPGLIKSMVESAISLEAQAASSELPSDMLQLNLTVVPFVRHEQQCG